MQREFRGFEASLADNATKKDILKLPGVGTVLYLEKTKQALFIADPQQKLLAKRSFDAFRRVRDAQFATKRAEKRIDSVRYMLRHDKLPSLATQEDLAVDNVLLKPKIGGGGGKLSKNPHNSIVWDGGAEQLNAIVAALNIDIDFIKVYAKGVRTLQNGFANVAAFFDASPMVRREVLLAEFYRAQLRRMQSSGREEFSLVSKPLHGAESEGKLIDVRATFSVDSRDDRAGGLTFSYAQRSGDDAPVLIHYETSATKDAALSLAPKSTASEVRREEFVTGDDVYERCYANAAWDEAKNSAVKEALEIIDDDPLANSSQPDRVLYDAVFDTETKRGPVGVVFPFFNGSDNDRVGKPRVVSGKRSSKEAVVVVLPVKENDAVYKPSDIQVTAAGLIRLGTAGVYKVSAADKKVVLRVRLVGDEDGASYDGRDTMTVCVQGDKIYDCATRGVIVVQRVAGTRKDSKGNKYYAAEEHDTIKYVLASDSSKVVSCAVYLRVAVIVTETHVHLVDVVDSNTVYKSVVKQEGSGWTAFASMRYFGAFNARGDVLFVCDALPAGVIAQQQQQQMEVDEEDDADEMQVDAVFVRDAETNEPKDTDATSLAALRRVHLAMLQLYTKNNKKFSYDAYRAIVDNAETLETFKKQFKALRPNNQREDASKEAIALLTQKNAEGDGSAYIGLTQSQYAQCVTEDLYGPLMLHWGLRGTQQVPLRSLVEARAFGALTVVGESANLRPIDSDFGTPQDFYDELEFDVFAALARTGCIRRVPQLTEQDGQLSEICAQLSHTLTAENVQANERYIETMSGDALNYAFYVLVNQAQDEASQSVALKRKADESKSGGGAGSDDEDDEFGGDGMSQLDIDIEEERSVKRARTVVEKLMEEKRADESSSELEPSLFKRKNVKKRPARRMIITSDDESSSDGGGGGGGGGGAAKQESAKLQKRRITPQPAAVLPERVRIVRLKQDQFILAMYGDERGEGAIVRLQLSRIKLTYDILDRAHAMSRGGAFEAASAPDLLTELRSTIFQRHFPQDGRHSMEYLYSQYSANNKYAVLYELNPEKKRSPYQIVIAQLDEERGAIVQKSISEKFGRLSVEPITSLVQLNDFGLALVHSKRTVKDGSGDLVDVPRIEYFSIARSERDADSESGGGNGSNNKTLLVGGVQGLTTHLVAHLSPSNRRGLVTVYSRNRNDIETLSFHSLEEDGYTLAGTEFVTLAANALRTRGYGVVRVARAGKMLSMLVRTEENKLSVLIAPVKRPNNVVEVAAIDMNVLPGDYTYAQIHMDARYVYVYTLSNTVYSVMYASREEVESSGRTSRRKDDGSSSSKRARLNPFSFSSAKSPLRRFYDDDKVEFSASGASIMETSSVDDFKVLEKKVRNFIASKQGTELSRVVSAEFLEPLSDAQQAILNHASNILRDVDALGTMVQSNTWALLALFCYTWIFNMLGEEENIEYELERTGERRANEVYEYVGSSRVRDLFMLIAATEDVEKNISRRKMLVVLASFFQDGMDDAEKKDIAASEYANTAMKLGVLFSPYEDISIFAPQDYTSDTATQLCESAHVGALFYEKYETLREQVSDTIKALL